MPAQITPSEFIKKMSSFELELSFTSICKFLDSPKTFMEYFTKERDAEESKVFLFGRAFHCLVLEGETEFYKRFAVEQKIDKRTKEGKAQAELFAQENEGKDIISASDFEDMQERIKAIKANKEAAKLLDDATGFEVAGTIQIEGFTLKTVKDIVLPDGVADLKTCKDAKFRPFLYSVRDHFYHLQAAIYTELGKFDFKWIACDKRNAVVYPLGNSAMEEGVKLLKNTMARIRQCAFLNEWERCASFYHQGKVIDF